MTWGRGGRAQLHSFQPVQGVALWTLLPPPPCWRSAAAWLAPVSLCPLHHMAAGAQNFSGGKGVKLRWVFLGGHKAGFSSNLHGPAAPQTLPTRMQILTERSRTMKCLLSFFKQPWGTEVSQGRAQQCSSSRGSESHTAAGWVAVLLPVPGTGIPKGCALGSPESRFREKVECTRENLTKEFLFLIQSSRPCSLN